MPYQENGSTYLRHAIVQADVSIAPFVNRGEHVLAGITPFPDHGNPVSLGSLVGKHPVLINAAERLSVEQSQASNQLIAEEINRRLIGDETGLIAVQNSSSKDRPKIYQVQKEAKPAPVTVYYVIGNYMRAPVFWIVGKAGSLEDIERIETLFEITGYTHTRKVIINTGNKGGSQ